MKSFIRVASAALVLSCLVSGVAAGQDRETVTAHVSHKGLDLANPEHRAILDARIMRVARRACAPRSADWAVVRDSKRCENEMRDSGRVAVAALIGRQPTELASAH